MLASSVQSGRIHTEFNVSECIYCQESLTKSVLPRVTKSVLQKVFHTECLHDVDVCDGDDVEDGNDD